MVERVRSASSSDLELIRKRPLAKELGVSPWTLDRWRKLGIFPAPIALTPTTLVWRRRDVARWVLERQQAGSKAAAG